MSLVTIVALCHNHAPFLRQALDSIVAQTYPHLEVWLVDNASQDGSPAILREYGQAHSDWHLLLLPENVGNCRAFNQAFFQSKGEFVVDFATDDELLPERLSQQVALFQQLPATYGMVYSNCALVSEMGEFVRLHHRPDPRRAGQLLPRPASGWVFADVLARYFISTPTMLMRRATLAALGGYDETLSYEDFDFWVRASRDWQFQYQNEVTTRKRLHPRSMSAQVTRQHDPYLASTIRICHKVLALCHTEPERAALRQRLRYELRHALRRRQWPAARELAGLLRQTAPPRWDDWLLGALLGQ
ncbi:MAG: glycosyltransferase family 2 protein [Janthinobacterium lividum]